MGHPLAATNFLCDLSLKLVKTVNNKENLKMKNYLASVAKKQILALGWKAVALGCSLTMIPLIPSAALAYEGGMTTSTDNYYYQEPTTDSWMPGESSISPSSDTDPSDEMNFYEPDPRSPGSEEEEVSSEPIDPPFVPDEETSPAQENPTDDATFDAAGECMGDGCLPEAEDNIDEAYAFAPISSTRDTDGDGVTDQILLNGEWVDVENVGVAPDPRNLERRAILIRINQIGREVESFNQMIADEEQRLAEARERYESALAEGGYDDDFDAQAQLIAQLWMAVELSEWAIEYYRDNIQRLLDERTALWAWYNR